MAGDEQARALAPAGPANESSSVEESAVRELARAAKGRAASAAPPAFPYLQVIDCCVACFMLGTLSFVCSSALLLQWSFTLESMLKVLS